jgi:hypothetical protein
MLSKNTLWLKIHDLACTSSPFYSLVRGHKYVVESVREEDQTLRVRFQSRRLRRIKLDDLYAIYTELYRLGRLPRNHFLDRSNSMRVLRKGYWHAPGAAMFAILPELDSSIIIEKGGHLSVSNAC